MLSDAGDDLTLESEEDWQRVKGLVQRMRSKESTNFDHSFAGKYTAIKKLRKLMGRAGGDESEVEWSEDELRGIKRKPMVQLHEASDMLKSLATPFRDFFSAYRNTLAGMFGQCLLVVMLVNSIYILG